MQRKTKRVLVLLLFVIATLAFVMSGASPADCSTSYPGGTSGGNYGGDGEIADSVKTDDSGGGEYYCRHEKAAWETTQEATCTENGREEYWCYNCGRMIDYRTIKQLGHNYSEWQIVTPATDSEDGLKVRYCDRCKDEETQIIPKTTHTHSFTETVVEPTCTERGYTLHQCTCGEHYEDSFKSALDHSFTNYISDGNATCTQDGTKTAKCDRCNETNTITDIGSRTGHTFDKQVATEKYLKSAATCTAKATYFYSCKCGEKGTATFEYGNALGHEYVNGVCNRCGEDEPKPTEGLEYALNWDKKSYNCSSANKAKSTDIVIASEYNGLPVTQIGQGTFYGKSWITSVYIPDSITDYGPGLFYDCSKLKTVR